MKYFVPIFLFASVIVCLNSGCNSYEEIELESIDAIHINQLDKNGIDVFVSARINNPNNFSINVIGSEFELYLDDKYVGIAKIDDRIKILKNAIASYDLNIKSDANASFGKMLPTLLKGMLTGKMKVRAKGHIEGRAFLFFKKRLKIDLTEIAELRS